MLQRISRMVVGLQQLALHACDLTIQEACSLLEHHLLDGHTTQLTELPPAGYTASLGKPGVNLGDEVQVNKTYHAGGSCIQWRPPDFLQVHTYLGFMIAVCFACRLVPSCTEHRGRAVAAQDRLQARSGRPAAAGPWGHQHRQHRWRDCFPQCLVRRQSTTAKNACVHVMHVRSVHKGCVAGGGTR